MSDKNSNCIQNYIDILVAPSLPLDEVFNTALHIFTTSDWFKGV